ncbi:helix-turn-helix domain-containing protein [Gemmatimonas sp.]|uniref:helix-turn-helix domain-containing protein n=1 Tax=Gemmatimonas sp. TaxID=1962908 RepID=UPI003566C6A8
MRPPTSPSSTFRHPFDALHGTPGNVRILRALATHGRPMATSELATRTGLNASGMRRSLTALANTGLVAHFGSARSIVYQLNATHPLAASLVGLYVAEAARVDRVLSDLRASAFELTVAPIAVWLYGSAARGDDGPLSDLDVAIIVEHEADVAPMVEAMRQRMEPTEARECVSTSLIGLSARDVARLESGDPWWLTVRADAIPLLGPSPETLAQWIEQEFGAP